MKHTQDSTLPAGKAEDATPQEAYDEACREYRLRQMMYPKWVREARLSRTDARQQLDRMALIVDLLSKVPGVTANTENPVDNGEVPF